MKKPRTSQGDRTRHGTSTTQSTINALVPYTNDTLFGCPVQPDQDYISNNVDASDDAIDMETGQVRTNLNEDLEAGETMLPITWGNAVSDSKEGIINEEVTVEPNSPIKVHQIQQMQQTSGIKTNVEQAPSFVIALGTIDQHQALATSFNKAASSSDNTKNKPTRLGNHPSHSKSRKNIADAEGFVPVFTKKSLRLECTRLE